MIGLMLLLFLGIIICLTAMYFYNRLVSYEYSINQGIKHLKEYFQTRKNYSKTLTSMVNEKQSKTLKKITKQYEIADKNDSLIENDNMLTQFIASIVEKKLSKDSTQLLNKIALTEKDYASAKRFVNSKTIAYNKLMETFPSSALGAILHKSPHMLFDLPDSEKEGIDPDYKA